MSGGPRVLVEVRSRTLALTVADHHGISRACIDSCHATPAASATLRRRGGRFWGRKCALLYPKTLQYGWGAWGPRQESATPTLPRGSSRVPLPGRAARVRRALRSAMAALRRAYEHIPKHVIGGSLAVTHMRGRYRYPGRRASYTHIAHHTGCAVVWSGYRNYSSGVYCQGAYP